MCGSDVAQQAEPFDMTACRVHKDVTRTWSCFGVPAWPRAQSLQRSHMQQAEAHTCIKMVAAGADVKNCLGCIASAKYACMRAAGMAVWTVWGVPVYT